MSQFYKNNIMHRLDQGQEQQEEEQVVSTKTVLDDDSSPYYTHHNHQGFSGRIDTTRLFGLWNNRGVALLDAGDLQGALDCFHYALEQCHQVANHDVNTNRTMATATSSTSQQQEKDDDQNPPLVQFLQLGLSQREITIRSIPHDEDYEMGTLDDDEDAASDDDDDEDEEPRQRIQNIAPSRHLFSRALTVRRITPPLPNTSSSSSSMTSSPFPLHHRHHDETIHSAIVIFNIAITYHVRALLQQQQKFQQQQQVMVALQQCFNLYQSSWGLLCEGLAAVSAAAAQQQEQQQQRGFGVGGDGIMTDISIMDIMGMAIWNNMALICHERDDIDGERICYTELLIWVKRRTSRTDTTSSTSTSTTTVANTSSSTATTATTAGDDAIPSTTNNTMTTPSSSFLSSLSTTANTTFMVVEEGDVDDDLSSSSTTTTTTTDVSSPSILETIRVNLFLNALTLVVGGGRPLAPAA